MNIAEIKQTVKERYSKCAETGGGEEPCCPSMSPSSKSFAAEHGLYRKEELSLIPETALKLSKGSSIWGQVL